VTKKMEKRFNIRVYGILINERSEVLVTDELRMGMQMTKFPGGGLHHGEGTIDCVKREFTEELNIEIEIVKHFYTTDHFQASAFNPNDQLISIYYLVKTPEPQKIKIENKFVFTENKDGAQLFRWIKLNEISENDFTFPIDKKVVGLLKEKHG